MCLAIKFDIMSLDCYISQSTCSITCDVAYAYHHAGNWFHCGMKLEKRLHNIVRVFLFINVQPK